MKGRTFSLFLVVCLTLFLTGMLPRSSEAGTLTIRGFEKAETAGDVIYLGQIAEVRGE